MQSPPKELWILVAMTALVFGWSAIGPHDRTTWLLEVAPVVVALPILAFTYRRFPLTPLAYRLIFLHGVILMVGGHYTYARVPIGDWIQEALELSRNHYDRLGHLAQGFVPAVLARELLLRLTPLRPGGWLFYIATSIALAISAFYELIEWWAAVLGGQAADSFLGTQGDVWDTQWDMFLALLGAVSALALLSRHHDRELARIGRTGAAG